MIHLNRNFRIGAVSYLNTKPLVHGLADLAPEAKLTFDLPSRLADQLAAGELDVALIPAVEYFRHANYTIVSDACIACHGPVWSVKLFSRVAASEIKTLALDEGSRTSAAMVRTLLADQFNVHPELHNLPIGNGLASADTDAVLLIGDRAMHAEEAGFAEVWDLGDTWCQSTKLPFVFAMWTAGPGFSDLELSQIDTVLTQARDVGLTELESITADEHEAFGLDYQSCLGYLRDNLHFQLGPRERSGLELFYQHAQRLSLVPKGRELKFHDCQIS